MIKYHGSNIKTTISSPPPEKQEFYINFRVSHLPLQLIKSEKDLSITDLSIYICFSYSCHAWLCDMVQQCT